VTPSPLRYLLFQCSNHGLVLIEQGNRQPHRIGVAFEQRYFGQQPATGLQGRIGGGGGQSGPIRSRIPFGSALQSSETVTGLAGQAQQGRSMPVPPLHAIEGSPPQHPPQDLAKQALVTER
jgi:hypothetical protein